MNLRACCLQPKSLVEHTGLGHKVQNGFEVRTSAFVRNTTSIDEHEVTCLLTFVETSDLAT